MSCVRALTAMRRTFSQGFHTSPQTCMKVKRPSSLGQRPGRPLRPQKPISESEYLPPLVLLKEASSSGALDIGPKDAVEVLKKYYHAIQNPSHGWEKSFCQSHNISPGTLAMLGMILRRCPNDGQRHLAKSLMTTASEMGDSQATFELVLSALRTGNIERNSGAAERCKRLAEEGKPQAMLLFGKMLLHRGLLRAALPWFVKAGKSELADALVHEGLVLKALKDDDAARIAFSKAAERDDPLACYHLSELDPTQEYECLMKAASGGIIEACHKLGMIELKKVEGAKSLADFGMAREWFEVASADGCGKSMLRMAAICKASGQTDSGMLWLKSAEGIPEVRDEARSLKLEWKG